MLAGCPSLQYIFAQEIPTRNKKNMQASEFSSTILQVSRRLYKETHNMTTRHQISLCKVVHKSVSECPRVAQELASPTFCYRFTPQRCHLYSDRRSRNRCCVCMCVLSSHIFWTSDLWAGQPGSYKRTVCSPSLLHAAQSLCQERRDFLGGRSAHLLDEMTPAVTASANPSAFSLRSPLWNDLDFVPGRVKPRSTCSSYPTISPPRISQLRYRKVFQITQTQPIDPELSLIPESISRSCRLFT